MSRPPHNPQNPYQQYGPPQGQPGYGYQQPMQMQQVGRSVTRTRASGAWHAMHITLTIFTGGLWGFVYLYKYLKMTSRYTETRHD